MCDKNTNKLFTDKFAFAMQNVARSIDEQKTSSRDSALATTMALTEVTKAISNNTEVVKETKEKYVDLLVRVVWVLILALIVLAGAKQVFEAI